MLVHVNHQHLLMNIFLQLFVGLFLEMTHGTKKLAIVYIFGVISGSLATSVFDQTVYLAGASGGCYALIAAHVATLIINWNDDVIILHQRFRLESVQDFLIKLDMKPCIHLVEISIFH